MAFTYSYTANGSYFSTQEGEDHYSGWVANGRACVGVSSNTGGTTTWVTRIKISNFYNGSTKDSISNIGYITIELPLDSNCKPSNCRACISTSELKTTEVKYTNTTITSSSTSKFYSNKECTSECIDSDYTSNGASKTIYCKLPVSHLTSTPVYVYMYRNNDSANGGSLWTESGNTKIYVHEKVSYTITANKGTGISSITMSPSGGVYDEGTNVTLTANVSNGYQFSAWSGDSNSTSSTITFNNLSGNKTVTANATTIPYTVSYDLGGGSVSSANPSSYNITTNTITLNNPTRVGYTFAGWTGSNGDTPQLSVKIEKGSTGNKSYTANWTAKTYTVVYKGNGGYWNNTDTWSTTVTYGTNYSVEPTFYIRNGYKFIGWTTNSDGSDDGLSWTTTDDAGTINYWSGEWVGVAGEWGIDSSDTVTLYARWEPLATIFTKISDTYVAGSPYVKIGDSWKKGTAVYVKVGNEWKLSTR